MTTKSRRTPGGSDLSNWIRTHPDLDSKKYYIDVQDIDFIVHQFVQGNLMFLEWKRGYTNFPDFAQRDTQSVIHQLARFACSSPDFHLHREHNGRPEKLNYYGYHVIQTEKTDPTNGGIRIDGITVSEEEFLRFLKFEWQLEEYERYEHWREDVFRIRQCSTSKDFATAKEYFRSTITKDHPEREVLLGTWIDQWQYVQAKQVQRKPRGVS